MHSRIMGIMTKKDYEELIEDIGPNVKLPYSLIEDNPPWGIDYVDSDTDLEDDFGWLCTILSSRGKSFEYNNKTHIIKFHQGYIEQYFKERFEQLRNALNKEDGFEKFCNLHEAYKYKHLIENDLGFIVGDVDGICDNLDGFIRKIDYDVEYIVFDSLDYNC